ncbi:MAG: glycosyltransferase [Gemmataceae bacterium]
MSSDDDNPLISVAMPVRNGDNFVASAVASVVAQTYGNWELVVSDNESSDETPSILADYARRDSRIRICRTPLIPVVENFNRAGELSRGRWVVFLCHDDVFRPHALQRLVDTLHRYRADRLALLSYGVEYEFENGYVTPPIAAATDQYFDGQSFLRVALGGRVPSPLPGMSQACVRTDVWRSLGRFDLRYQHCDTFLWYRLLLEHDMAVVPDSLVCIRIHSRQGSATIRRESQSIREYEQFFGEFVRENGKSLDLSPLTRLVAPARYLSVAATEIVLHLLKCDFDRALRIVGQVPVVWHSLLVPLCVRNLRSELRRTRELRRHVPVSLIYPS